MSRTRRNFSAKFKSELVIELLKGEKDLNTIATENNIQPNLLRNWKKEFLDKASVVFDDTPNTTISEKQGRLLGNMCIHTTLNVVIPHSIIRHRHPAIIQSCYWMIMQPKGDFLPYSVTYISSL